MPKEGQTGTAPDGTRVVFRNGQVVPLVSVQNPAAPGASYLPNSRSQTNPSEEAYWSKFRQADDPSQTSAAAALQAARRAEGILARQKTGGIYSVPVVGNVAGMFDPEIRELDAIQAEVARTKNTPGSGAISDFDANQFLQMTYGKDKPTETNRMLIQAQRVANDATIQRRQFAEWYKQNYGTTNGFQEAWSRYAQDNPIFDPASVSGGTPALNANSKNWREYFGAGGDARGTAATADVSRSGIYDLSKGQSRASIPIGSMYKDPQGNVRRNENADAGNPIIVPAKKPPAAKRAATARQAAGDDYKLVRVKE